MAAKDRSVYEIFTIKSNDGEKTIDLRGGIVSFSYFENVFSKSLFSFYKDLLIQIFGSFFSLNFFKNFFKKTIIFF